MLSPNDALNKLLTISRIIVKNDDGYKYLTMASHGFLLGFELVYHSNVNGTQLSKVHNHYINFDITLLKISSSQSFCNETFTAKLLDGINISF